MKKYNFEMKDYQTLVIRQDADEQDKVLDGCLGLISRAGEIVSTVRNYELYGEESDAEQFKRKLTAKCGWMLWCCAELAAGLQENLCTIYEKQQKTFCEEVHNMNSAATMETVAARLAIASNRPFVELYDCVYDKNNPVEVAWQKAQAKAEIVGIMVMIRDMLERYCDATILDAMERNIIEMRGFIINTPGE
jgi:hypothetical protein